MSRTTSPPVGRCAPVKKGGSDAAWSTTRRCDSAGHGELATRHDGNDDRSRRGHPPEPSCFIGPASQRFHSQRQRRRGLQSREEGGAPTWIRSPTKTKVENGAVSVDKPQTRPVPATAQGVGPVRSRQQGSSRGCQSVDQTPPTLQPMPARVGGAVVHCATVKSLPVGEASKKKRGIKNK